MSDNDQTEYKVCKYKTNLDESAHKYLKNHPEIEIGECIEQISQNQAGSAKFEVIDDGNGGKTLKVVYSMDDFPSWGGRRTRRRRHRKTRTRRRRYKKHRKSRK